MKGDVKMCRYLIHSGASTTKTVGKKFDSPLQVAARFGCLDVCKLLVLCGALCPDDATARVAEESIHQPHTSGANVYATCEQLVHGTEDRVSAANTFKTLQRLVEWSKDVLQTHSMVVTFLLGTLPCTSERNQGCILQCLSGHPGIWKHIADCIGLEVTKAKELRILRSVVEVLPETMRNGRKEKQKKPRVDYTVYCGQLVKRRIAKDFGGVVYFGTIGSFKRDEDSDNVVWSVQYDDGDREKIGEKQLWEVLMIYDAFKHRDTKLKPLAKSDADADADATPT